MTDTITLEQAYQIGYDDGYDSALTSGEAGGDFTEGLLDDGVRSAMEYLGEDPDAGAEPDEDGERYDPEPEWTGAFSAKVDEYQRGAVAGSEAAVVALRNDARERHIYAIVGIPGSRYHNWERFHADDRERAEGWAKRVRDRLLADNPAQGSLPYDVLSGDVAFDQRWQDGRRIYWNTEG